MNIILTVKRKAAYQLAFVTPGILPAEAISLKVTLEIPNFLMYPLGLPVNLQRL